MNFKTAFATPGRAPRAHRPRASAQRRLHPSHWQLGIQKARRCQRSWLPLPGVLACFLRSPRCVHLLDLVLLLDLFPGTELPEPRARGRDPGLRAPAAGTSADQMMNPAAGHASAISVCCEAYAAAQVPCQQ